MGKVVLITGASRGIGADLARIAGRSGATVLLVARGLEALEAVAAEITHEGGRAHVYQVDLGSLEAVDGLAASVLADHGGVDVLVHNAARSIRRAVEDTSDRFHDYERTMQLNYFSPVRLTLALLPSLRERRGSVGLVLSMGVLIPGPNFAAYLASKAALDAFGDALAAEHGDQVLVSAAYLPLVRTAMIAPSAEFAELKNVMTSGRAAHLVLGGLVEGKRRVMTPVGRYLAFANRHRSQRTTRVLNLLRRTFPAGDRPSAHPRLKVVLQRMLGGPPF